MESREARTLKLESREAGARLQPTAQAVGKLQIPGKAP